MKIGISGTKLNKNGTSSRAQRQVNAWNKNNPNRYRAQVIHRNIKDRSRAKQWEQASVNRAYKRGKLDLKQGKHKLPRPRY